MVVMLLKLMPNIANPRSCKRRKLTGGCAETGCAQSVCAYRSVCGSAPLVISKCIPIGLLAVKTNNIYEAKEQGADMAISTMERTTIHHYREQSWRSQARGRWTAREINEVQLWINMKYGDVNFYLAKFLSGHDHFNAYFFRDKKPSPKFDYCLIHCTNL
ncbi:uncharacterized protein LOC117171032 [Belonocnema kinseyi]|uniref:uncharacterized protein LOC117171032 n=1 Tax=Belonocnema kinseyi TaxID=2817044 RepID=UPI00143DCB91|nr:uncharacterized protein LOC117171032 [Belonocnema kinseyi]